MHKYRIAWVVGGKLVNGGTENFLMNYYRNFNLDYIQVDFIIHGYEQGIHEDEIKKLGGQVFYVSVRGDNIVKNNQELYNIFSQNNYAIVHAHMNAMSAPVLRVAKQANIPIRIAHAHACYYQIYDHGLKKIIKLGLNYTEKKLLPKFATELFACSKDSAMWLYGSKNISNAIIIPNAINTDIFKFSSKIRANIRQKYNIENKKVIGHVGRFDKQKNQIFLVKLLSILISKDPSYRLLLVGDGPKLDYIKNYAYKLNMLDYIIFTGNQSNVSDFLNSMDMFIMPSIYEGLGISLIEAQANGLYCLASSSIPQEVNITKNILFIDLKQDINIWINTITKFFNSNTSNINLRERILYSNKVKNAGYDIKEQATNLERIYINLINKNL